MIYATVNMTIGDYSSTCDKKILLYRGDKNVEIRFVMKGNKFTVLDSTYAQMIIKRPSAVSVFSEPALIQNDTVVLTITEDMVDELAEIGEYTFQIRLYDTDMTARATLPPCNSCLIIERPIAVEGEAAINAAIINDSAIMPAVQTSEEEIFTEDDQYNKTIWMDGDLITDARMNKIEDALYYINRKGGTGGGGGTAPYISTELPETVMVGTGDDFDLFLDFTSPNMGKGTLKVFINDVDVMSVKIDQGESITPIPGDLLSKGTNRVVIYVLDRVGLMSNSLTFYVRYGSTELTSDFDQYSAYDYGATIRYYFTPTALDTSSKLTFYMSIDGQVQPGVSCTSDTRGYFTFPSNLSADSHYCEAYILDDRGVKSNVLTFNLVILSANTIVVASDTKNVTLEEGAQLSLDYKVYMRDNASFITKTYVDNNLVNIGTCGLDFNYYRTSSLTEGIHTIKLEVWDVTETYSDYITWTVTVTESTFEAIQPTNAGAIFIATAVNKSNADERKNEFIGRDEAGVEISGTLHNFAFNSESGWIDDELIISGNSHVEIPIQPLANNARYGFTLDLEFTSRQIGVPDAEVLTLWNEDKNCGIRITTENLILRSAEGNECNLYYADNERTNVMFVIDRQERKAKIYLNGVMCEAFHLSDYSIEGVSYLEDFTVNSNLILGGLNKNGYSKIRNLRIYNIALTTNEIINNWISCEIDKGKQRELVEFQNGNDLPTLYIYCDFSGLGKDDKKPCKIVYNSTDEEKYGKSFNLDHKESTCQYQGTSSMAYPIKNYRINLADENGDKWKYDFPGGQPEHRFTLKADFMNSCHAHNTGMAKFINDNLYNYKLNDEKSMNPFKWHHVQNGGNVNDFREAINGFPCRLILVNDGETPLNEGQNEPTPGNTKDMGIFNFNHDKDATTTLGFDSDIFPNCASYEVTANSDTSAGAFMSYKGKSGDFKTGGFAEVNIRIYLGRHYTSLFPVELFNGLDLDNVTLSPRTMEMQGVNENYEEIVTSGNLTEVLVEGVKYIRFITYYEISKVNDVEIRVINEVDYMPTDIAQIYQEFTDEDELDYIKQSFELRYPDEDDVPEGWGFMGIGDSMPKINYWTDGSGDIGYYTAKISLENLGTRTISVDFSEQMSGVEVYVYNYNADYLRVHRTSTSTPITFNDTDYYFAIKTNKYFIDNKGLITINDVEYEFGDLMEFTDNKSVIQNLKVDVASGLKALIDWVDNCTDEEFVRDFERHFHKDYTLRYYALVVLIGAVDNLGKNMMLDTADNKIFFPRFYDIDTILSYDNSGDIKFDVDIEMEQGYWNTSSSRLWTRIRELMHDDVVAIYNNMRQNGVSYDNIMKYMYGEQISKIPQKYYNMDYDIKYAPFEDSYIGMAHGNGYEHMKHWLKSRFIFCDTLFDYAPSYNNDILTIRVNTTEPIQFEIETYTPVYQHLSWYNGQMDKKKIDGKTSVAFTGTVQAATDQEVLIYGGSNVKVIKGLQSGNPNRLIIGSATKLVELDAHDCPLLSEINMNKANLSPHVYLTKVNLSNCPLLGGNLILNNSPLIQEVDVRGTAITGLNLPSSIRNLEILRLSNAIQNLTLNDAGMLHTLEFDEGVNLQSVSMTNCNALENVTGLDLLQTPSITLNNSYNTAAELYFRDTTNLSLSNMSNLERVIFTPNNEYETFELINVANAPDYKVTTFNCPKLSTFMTTAPYRDSYNNCGMIDKETLFNPSKAYFKIGQVKYDTGEVDTSLESRLYSNFYPINTNKTNISFKSNINNIQVLSRFFDVNLNYLGIGNDTWSSSGTFTVPDGTAYVRFVIKDGTIDNRPTDLSIVNSLIISVDSVDIPCEYNVNATDYGLGDRIEITQIKAHGDIQPDITFTANNLDISSTQFTDVKLLCTTDVNTLKLPTTVKNFYCDSSFDLDTDWLKDGEYDVVHGELVEPYTTDYEGEVLKVTSTDIKYIAGDPRLIIYSDDMHRTEIFKSNYRVKIHRVGYIPFIVFYDANGVEQEQWYLGYAQSEGAYRVVDMQEKGYEYFAIAGNNFDKSGVNIIIEDKTTPNIIPSSADGSIIMSMYAPSQTVAPSSGIWDLKGLEFDNFHTYGMNNDVITNYFYDIMKNGSAYFTMPIDCTSLYFKNTSGNAINVHLMTTSGLIMMNNHRIDAGEEFTLNVSNSYRGQQMGYSVTNIQNLFDLIVIKNDTKCNITMPARYDDYNISIKNANISPKTHNTMLYPLLVNEENPIEGELDYTNYEGDYLSWSFAYTDLNKVNIEQPKDELLNSYKYGYNAFYETEYEFDNPYEVARYTCSASGVLPTFNTEFTYTYDEQDNGDGTYTTKIYTDSLDNLPSNISFINISSLLTVGKLNTSNVTSMRNMFGGCSELTSVDVTNWDTTGVTDMYFMFGYCNKLTSIIGGLDTSSVTNMGNMFQNCGNLTSLDLSNFDTSNVTNMNGVFRGCGNLTSLNVTEFNTSNVTDMSYMFYYCNNLTSLDVSGFDTSNVTTMSNMFYNCNNLTSLDVSEFDTSNVADMGAMFYYCNNLTSLDLSNFDTTEVTNMTGMFTSCTKLSSLDLSGFNTSNVTTMRNMFYACNNLTSLDLSSFDTSEVTDMTNMFYNCNNLTSLNVSNWSSDNVNTIIPQLSVSPSTSTLYGTVIIDETTLPSGWVYNNPFIIAEYTANATGVLPTFNTEFISYTTGETDNGDGTYTVSIATNSLDNLPTSISFNAKTALLSVKKLNTTEVTTMYYMFYGCTNLTSINVSSFDTSKVTNMWSMFQNCRSLTSLDLSGFDTSNVTTMNSMFRECRGLTSLDVSGFDTSNVTNMNYMFHNCINLISLDLSEFNTSEVTTMSQMFQNCNNLTSLDLSSFNTNKVTNMYYMFRDCNSLTSLNVSSFNTSNVTTMESMFNGCSGLTSLDVSEFVTSKVNTMGSMFYNCSGLTSLDVSGFDTSNVTNMSYMFNNCSGLTSLDLSSFDTMKVANMGNMFYNCKNLIELDSMQNISTGLDLSSTILDVNSLLDVIDNLATLMSNPTLTLGSKLLVKLSEDQIVIATNKGWTVA